MLLQVFNTDKHGWQMRLSLTYATSFPSQPLNIPSCHFTLHTSHFTTLHTSQHPFMSTLSIPSCPLHECRLLLLPLLLLVLITKYPPLLSSVCTPSSYLCGGSLLLLPLLLLVIVTNYPPLFSSICTPSSNLCGRITFPAPAKFWHPISALTLCVSL